MKRNHGNGGSCIKTFLRGTKNAAVEDGATARRRFILGTSPGQIHRVPGWKVVSASIFWYKIFGASSLRCNAHYLLSGPEDD
jgi:hypothetical protein